MSINSVTGVILLAVSQESLLLSTDDDEQSHSFMEKNVEQMYLQAVADLHEVLYRNLGRYKANAQSRRIIRGIQAILGEFILCSES